VARAGQQVKTAAAGIRLTERIGIGVLTAAFPPDVVDVAVDEWDAREQRTRILPARVMVYYAMAMILFFDSGYGEVWNKLLSGLDWAKTYRRRCQADMQPSTAGLSKGRARLGWEPLAELLRLSMTPIAATAKDAPWAYWRGLRKLAIDGFTMNVQATEKNDAEFGRPSNEKGEGAFPQVRTVALAETGTRTLQGVEVGPLSTGEQTMARKLWPLLSPGDLVVADRLFLSHADLAAVVATGAHAIFRVKADVDLPVLEVLPDGSYLSRIADPEQAKRLRRKKADPADIPGITVRIVEYSVSAGDEPGGIEGGVGDGRSASCSAWPARCSTTRPTRLKSSPTATASAGNLRPRSAMWKPGCVVARRRCCAPRAPTWSAKRCTPCCASIKRSGI
jgi:hypothetical protein